VLAGERRGVGGDRRLHAFLQREIERGARDAALRADVGGQGGEQPVDEVRGAARRPVQGGRQRLRAGARDLAGGEDAVREQLAEDVLAAGESAIEVPQRVVGGRRAGND